jgi:cation diffusion facilitator CzcD-associated flavoprotein CzcO
MNEELIAQQEEAWRESFDTLITSPELRTILTPHYRFGCRRPLVSNSYYQAFQKPTVTAMGGTIKQVLPDGVLTTDAGRIDVDTIIFATGFDAQGMLGSLRVDNGRGQRLEEQWKDRPQAYLCTLVKDFPNLFLINGPNAGGPVVTDVIAAQAAYIANCLGYAAQPGATVEVRPRAFERYNRDVEQRAAGSVLVRGGCSSWYRAGGGDGQVFSHWPGTITSLREALAQAPRSDLIISISPLAAGLSASSGSTAP